MAQTRDRPLEQATQLFRVGRTELRLEVPLRLQPRFARALELAFSRSGERQPGRAAVLLVDAERNQAIPLERPKVVTERGAVHDELGGESLERRRAEPIQHGEHRVLRHAQPRIRQRRIVELRDLTGHLPHRQAIAGSLARHPRWIRAHALIVKAHATKDEVESQTAMKATLQFNPQGRSYGPATESVRAILSGWAEVDWFGQGPRNPLRAAQRFAEHHARARLHLPDQFPPSFEARLRKGDWSTFAELCQRARARDGWDWKHGPLERLSVEHARAKKWSAEKESLHPQPGDLLLGMSVDFAASLPTERAELAAWYKSYADVDALFAIEWQLAERSNDTSENPFLPLLDCYASGILPFGFGPDEFVLFALSEP